MKILLISDNKIFGHGGGSLEEHKYYDGIKRFALKTSAVFQVISIDEPFEDSFPIEVKKNKFIDIVCRVLGHSTYMYYMWKKEKQKILEFNPDIVFLGRSRMGFISKDIKRIQPTCKIVCNMENVELDYVDGYFADRKGMLKGAYIYLEKYCVKRDERDAVLYSDVLNFLTQRDFKRSHELYSVGAKIENILPICIKSETKLTKVSHRKNIVFVGSLCYGSNVNALTTFINSVWKKYYINRKDLNLIVAGSKPDGLLKKLIGSLPNGILYENFRNLEDIVPIGSMMIAPIQKGAGMKVKVAETLSMGLCIAASDEALVGYEKALKHDILGSIFRANSRIEYLNAIEKYCDKSEEELSNICIQNKKIYREFYSYEISGKVIEDLCEKIQRY